ncbi:hypothetical protein Tsubulata_015875 [Turnera subulata]|uniref:Uncharacterized protein n=1 Tax=Turnera subulata TaxID=218843 RepID=A0A9Q0GHQ4_9ROSI|nr:hypothetical protein Tsubulata_015875 [Turnera subulata]
MLWFLPTIAGQYLSLVALRKPLAGFEAVLLALYSHETTSRSGLGCDGGDEVAGGGGVGASVVEDELGEDTFQEAMTATTMLAVAVLDLMSVAN